MSEPPAHRPVPLLVLGDNRRRRLREQVTRIVSEWHSAWACEGAPPLVVEVPVAGGVQARPAGRERVMLAAFKGDERLLYAETATGFVKSLCVPGSRDSVSFSSPGGSLEGALTEAAVRALCASLAHAALPSASCQVRACDPVDPQDCGPVRQPRDIRLTISSDRPESGAALELCLSPALVDALLGVRPPVAKKESFMARKQAADGERVVVTVTLGSASVCWRDLTELAVGDAILLDQDLDAACVLTIGGSETIAEGHLGRLDRLRAVQVAHVGGHNKA